MLIEINHCIQGRIFILVDEIRLITNCRCTDEWTVPAERMKMKKQHFVPLYCDRKTMNDPTNNKSITIEKINFQSLSKQEIMNAFHRFSTKEMYTILNKSPATFYRRLREGKYPPPHKDGRLNYWLAEDIQKCNE